MFGVQVLAVNSVKIVNVKHVYLFYLFKDHVVVSIVQTVMIIMEEEGKSSK